MALSARGPQIKVQDQSMNHALSQSLTQIIHIRARAHRWPMLALFIVELVYDAADKHLSEDYFRWWFNCVSFIYGSYVVAYVNPNDFNHIKAADLSRLSFLRLI